MKVRVALASVVCVMGLHPPNAHASDEPLTVVEAVAPEWPPIALQARVSLAVQVDVEVDEAGQVTAAKPRVDPAVPIAALFEKPTRDAALQWRFTPAAAAGSGPRSVMITFTYTSKTNDRPIENHQQLEQRKVAFKPPLEIELTAAPYVCYTPGEIKGR